MLYAPWMATLPGDPEIYQVFDVSAVLFALDAPHSSTNILQTWRILDSNTKASPRPPRKSEQN